MPTRQEQQARRQEVITLTARGWSAQQIADQLGCTSRTIERDRANFRTTRIPLDRESILDMLVMELRLARHTPDRMLVLDRILKLSDHVASDNRIPELLTAMKSALEKAEVSEAQD